MCVDRKLPQPRHRRCSLNTVQQVIDRPKIGFLTNGYQLYRHHYCTSLIFGFLTLWYVVSNLYYAQSTCQFPASLSQSPFRNGIQEAALLFPIFGPVRTGSASSNICMGPDKRHLEKRPHTGRVAVYFFDRVDAKIMEDGQDGDTVTENGNVL
ncbi:hypothetical protein BDV10DRAFT_107484 [Aspergillus recurvatus]